MKETLLNKVKTSTAAGPGMPPTGLNAGSTARVCKAYLELSHGLLDGSFGIHTVHVVQVNMIGVQPFQRCFACFPVSKSTCQQRCARAPTIHIGEKKSCWLQGVAVKVCHVQHT